MQVIAYSLVTPCLLACKPAGPDWRTLSVLCHHDAAGKGKAEGPEAQRGRADLAETLWQLSNPYKDGRTLGDQWMEARGKQRVPGPEMSRGRQVCHCMSMLLKVRCNRGTAFVQSISVPHTHLSPAACNLLSFWLLQLLRCQAVLQHT